jgi:glycerol-3-phosphate cytidylyltransferase
MAVVYTGGTFDLVHSGHIRLLEACKKIAGPGGKVIVGLNGDDFIEQYKGKPPVMTYSERRAVLMACKYVDDVIGNVGGADSKPTLIKVRPEFIVVGDDWAKKDYYAQMQFSQKWLDAWGIQLVYVPYTQGISSTDIKKRIINHF